MNRFSCVLALLACAFIGNGTANADNKDPPKRVAIMIFDGVEIIDYPLWDQRD